eukprot:jgi/Mesen1/8076/ME000434S07323
MNQFKPIFLGTVDPRSQMAQLRRAVDTQKCIRAGGKHNDLDDVGKDTYHHTFFEMLGNWSFGDYFKQEAISWAWELLTQVYKLPEDRLYATYFGGDEKLGLDPDTEARDIWLKFLPASRVLPFGCKVRAPTTAGGTPVPPATHGGGWGVPLPLSLNGYLLPGAGWRWGHLGGAVGVGERGPGAWGRIDRLVAVVADLMGGVFPELKRNEDKIRDILADEEATFGRTLQKGLQKFQKAASEVKDGLLSGQDAFVLWDTFGFPVDLTQLMAEERGLKVDMEAYTRTLNDARQLSRSARKVAGGALAMEAEATAELSSRGVAGGALAMEAEATAELSSRGEHPTKLRAIFTGGGFVDSLGGKEGKDGEEEEEEVGLILESSSFYAEQGGQTFDTGAVEAPGGAFTVKAVQVYGGYVLHDVLGDHIDQKGSLVVEDKLRFDFSHGKPIDAKDLGKIEQIVSRQISEALPVYAQEASLAEARRVMGLRAVFGEVYPDPVRVVSIGAPVEQLLKDPENPAWSRLSIEFCGGTHLGNTKEAQTFALVSEEGIAKGVRRIVAYTMQRAHDTVAAGAAFSKRIDAAGQLQGADLEREVAALKSALDPAVIPAAQKAQLKADLAALMERIRAAQKAASGTNLQTAITAAVARAGVAAASGETTCVMRIDVGLDTNAVKEAVSKDLAVMMFSVDEGKNKVLAYAGVPDAVAKRGLPVLDWLRAALKPVDGKGGGGKGGLAQGQGGNAAGVEEAMQVAISFAAEKLK